MFIQLVKITRSSSQISYVHTAIQHHIREKERASMQTLLSGVYNTDFNEGPPWTEQDNPQCIPTGVRPSHSVWPQGSLSFEWQHRAFSARYVFTYYTIFQLISDCRTHFISPASENKQSSVLLRVQDKPLCSQIESGFNREPQTTRKYTKCFYPR